MVDIESREQDLVRELIMTKRILSEFNRVNSVNRLRQSKSGRFGLKVVGKCRWKIIFLDVRRKNMRLLTINQLVDVLKQSFLIDGFQLVVVIGR